MLKASVLRMQMAVPPPLPAGLSLRTTTKPLRVAVLGGFSHVSERRITSKSLESSEIWVLRCLKDRQFHWRIRRFLGGWGGAIVGWRRNEVVAWASKECLRGDFRVTSGLYGRKESVEYEVEKKANNRERFRRRGGGWWRIGGSRSGAPLFSAHGEAQPQHGAVRALRSATQRGAYVHCPLRV